MLSSREVRIVDTLMRILSTQIIAGMSKIAICVFTAYSTKIVSIVRHGIIPNHAQTVNIYLNVKIVIM